MAHSEPPEYTNELFVGLVNNGHKEGKRKWTQKLQVENCWVSFKLDTGSDVSIISEQQYLKLKPTPQLEKSPAVMTSYSGERIRDTEAETRGGEHGFSRWSLPSLRHRRHSCRTSAQSRTASHQCPASTQGDHTLDHTLDHLTFYTHHTTPHHTTPQHNTTQHNTTQHNTTQQIRAQIH